MNPIKKKVLFSIVAMLFIGMTNQSAHALQSNVAVLVENARIDCRLTTDGTATRCGVPQWNNSIITGVTNHISAKLYPAGTIDPSITNSSSYSTPNLDGVVIWTAMNSNYNTSMAIIQAVRMGGDLNRRTIANSFTHPIYRPSSPQYDEIAQRVCFVEGGGPKPGIYCLDYADGSNLTQVFDLHSHRSPNHNGTVGVIDHFDTITNYTMDPYDGTHCWTDGRAITVMCIDITTPSPDPTMVAVQLLASADTGLSGVIGISSKNGMLYVTDGNGEVHRIAADGSRALLATGQDRTFGIDTDGINIYFTIEDTGELKKMDMDGGNLHLLNEYSYIQKRWGRPDKDKVRIQSIGWISLAANPMSQAQQDAQLAAEEAAKQLALANVRQANAIAAQARADKLAAQQAAALAKHQAAVTAGGTVADPRAACGFRVNKKGHTRVTCSGSVSPGVPTTYKIYIFPSGSERNPDANGYFAKGSTDRPLNVSVKGGVAVPTASMMVQIVTPLKDFPARSVKVKKK